jgi:uncharacterized membrane-anchored protein YitT (DUF2179 family)
MKIDEDLIMIIFLIIIWLIPLFKINFALLTIKEIIFLVLWSILMGYFLGLLFKKIWWMIKNE